MYYMNKCVDLCELCVLSLKDFEFQLDVTYSNG